LWFGGVLVFVFVSLSVSGLLLPRKSALRTENTANGRFMAR
jgi:hypothetical protein